MSEFPLTDEALHEIIIRLETQLLRSLPREEDLDYVFSERFERKRKKLRRQQKASSALRSVKDDSTK